MRRKLTPTFFIVLAIALLAGCGAEAPTTDTISSEAPPVQRPKAVLLMQSDCASCHNLVPGTNDFAIAPSMGDIRTAYLSAFPEREAFVQAVIAFSKNPTAEAALMGDAVVKYGLMPKLGFDDSELSTIAQYLYLKEVGTEAWYKGLGTATNVPESQKDLDYEARGRKYALGTKQALGSKLLSAVQQLGPAGAVDFCNIHALPITDSMAVHYGATIRRVSDKPRNPANRATAEELAYIGALAAARANGEELRSLIVENEGSVQAMYAIETNDMCLKCHGRKDADISAETWQAIAARYPRDEATGYGINEIRGLFVVEMKR